MDEKNLIDSFGTAFFELPEKTAEFFTDKSGKGHGTKSPAGKKHGGSGGHGGGGHAKPAGGGGHGHH